MESLKKAFRACCLVFMILLATIGVGLAGGVPLPISRKREDEPIAIEMFEQDKVKEQDGLEASKENT